jgi:signal transduction histidine kinase
MKNQLTLTEAKLVMLMRHTPMGLVEMDKTGKIIHLNITGESLLKSILVANNIPGKNFYPVLEHIAPSAAEKIRNSPDEAGDIIINETHSFCLSLGGENIERHFNFTITKISADCIIIGFDDVTEKYQRDQAILQSLLDKAVAQGKFEITSNVLHDIGNAVVGIGSYLNRIRRVLEKENTSNLENLAAFFVKQEAELVTSFGEAKAGAVVTMLNSLTETQRVNLEELRNSVKEQLHIITHIQEILNIQRQYLSGNETQEKDSTDLRSIITDCMSMLLASIEKRGIKVTLGVPTGLPAINGNRTKLMQVILNILKNSMEAIDLNAAIKNISITVFVDADSLVLQVQDSGHGFDEATGKQLFARGFTTKASGSGLGLNNCRSIIESHGGSIDMTSEGYGKGALITIKFKIEASQ